MGLIELPKLWGYGTTTVPATSIIISKNNRPIYG